MILTIFVFTVCKAAASGVQNNNIQPIKSEVDNPLQEYKKEYQEAIQQDVKTMLNDLDKNEKVEDSFQIKEKTKILESILWGVSNNEKVEYFVNYFTTKTRERFKIWLSRSAKYLPLISKIFEEHGVAQELIFLPLIESGFSPYATSRAQAVGIWQFMKGTAIKYGLRVDKFIDERRDPEKSAKAAALYLSDLYKMFGSWDFALAAYNAGEGKIMRTMESVGSLDFWDVISHKKIKRETKEYVPRFVAATLIAKEPEEYGFDDIEYETNIEYEEVLLPPKTTLKSVADAIHVDESLIKNLNPSIKHGFLPPFTEYPVKIPIEKKEILLSKLHLLKTADAKAIKRVMAIREKKSFSKKHRIKKYRRIANAERNRFDKRS